MFSLNDENGNLRPYKNLNIYDINHEDDVLHAKNENREFLVPII